MVKSDPVHLVGVLKKKWELSIPENKHFKKQYFNKH